MFGPIGILRVVTGAARAIAKTRLQTSGVPFYLMVWLSFPIFNLLLVALIYRADPALRNYAVIGGAGMALLFGMQFNAGEILDGERQRGTLGNLFLSPAPRYSWLAGFQLFAVTESLVTATLSVAIGKAIFGLPLDIAPAALVVTMVLFVAAMWGFSMVVGSIGVAIRNANQLSNLIFPLMQLVAGTMYPISLMPGWIEVPARCLPFGYGIQALVDSVTRGASLSDVSGDLLPLAGFAVGLPLLGIVAFRAVERRTRNRGTLELV
ncbi:MAG: ABC transporter permease [Actinomycetota bacterium]|jgi:ABC-2 type transport system permease protein|nr:ABC transporter permease [Actinomycetota bacterium]